MLDLLDRDIRVILLTARPQRVHELTEAWLRRYEIRWDVLIMRPWGDYELSRDFKQSSLWDLRDYGFEVLLGIEDDRRNVEMLRVGGRPDALPPLAATTTERSRVARRVGRVGRRPIAIRSDSRSPLAALASLRNSLGVDGVPSLVHSERRLRCMSYRECRVGRTPSSLLGGGGEAGGADDSCFVLELGGDDAGCGSRCGGGTSPPSC